MDDEQEPEPDQPVAKRTMRDRLFQRSASPQPSDADKPDDEPGADAEADQRAIEEEFWNKK